MKGVVFTEFLEMVEEKFSPEVADRVVTSCDLSTGGAYTAVGTYDAGEMIQLVTRLAEVVGAPVSDLLLAFGRHLFARFVVLYPMFFERARGSFDFLGNVETYIHLEVRKLFPDAELPRFDTHPRGSALEMVYRSERPFAKLAEGLIRGCIDHFREAITLSSEPVGDDSGTAVRFLLTPAAEATR